MIKNPRLDGMRDSMAFPNRKVSRHQHMQIYVVTKTHLADKALLQSRDFRHIGAVSRSSAAGARICRRALKRMIGEAQRAAQSSAAGLPVNSPTVMPMKAKPDVMASLT